MPATSTQTLAPGAYSTEVATTPNAVFAVNSSELVEVQSKNEGTTPDTWTSLGNVEPNGSASFIAPAEAIRIYNLGVTNDSADVTVYA